MLDDKRKSIQPMAARLPDVHDQALNDFVTDSPWDPVPVRERLAHRMDEEIDSEAGVLGDTGYLKSGDASVCVARQYTGTAGKVTNWQVGVSLHLASEVASFPVNWRLFVPQPSMSEKGETVRWQPPSANPDAPPGRTRRRAWRPRPNRSILRYSNGKPVTSRRYDRLWQRLGKHLPWVAAQQVSMHWLRHTRMRATHRPPRPSLAGLRS